MDTEQKQTMRKALVALRKEWKDKAAHYITTTNLTYLEISREMGVSEHWVYNVAKERGIGRNPEVSHEDL